MSDEPKRQSLTPQGMDIEFCRVLAAGVLGNPRSLELVEVSSSSEGFRALHEERIDVLAGAAWNFLNDVKEPTTGVGFSFSVPYYYYNSLFNTRGR